MKIETKQEIITYFLILLTVNKTIKISFIIKEVKVIVEIAKSSCLDQSVMIIMAVP